MSSIYSVIKTGVKSNEEGNIINCLLAKCKINHCKEENVKHLIAEG